MIYFILSSEINAVKIGFTTNVEQRLSVLQTGSPHELKLVKVISGSPRKEKQLHKKFAEYNIRGEWFHWNDVIKNYVETLTPYKDAVTTNEDFIRCPSNFAVLKVGDKQINMNLENHWNRKCKASDVKLLIDLVVRENQNTYLIHVNKKTRLDITKDLNISESQITLCLKNLIMNKLISRVNRGCYMVNPTCLWRGSEKVFNKKVDKWLEMTSD